jgi:uncharacterized membrane-anchored protein
MKKRKAGLLLTASLVCIISSGFAAIKYYEVRNSKGEVVLQHEAAPPLSKDDLTELQKRQEKLEEARKTLKPGTAAAVYLAKDNPEKDITIIENMLSFSEFPAFQSIAQKFVRLPAEMKPDYLFKEGKVSYEFIPDYNPEDIYREAEESKKEIVVKEIKRTDQIRSLHATYAKMDSFIHVTIRRNMAGKEVYPMEHESVEKVNINGSDALYLQIQTPDGNRIKQVKWTKNGTNLLFVVSSSAKEISKDDIIAMAKSLE